MNLFRKSKEIKINNKQPFEKDKLEREKGIYNLINQIESPITPCSKGLSTSSILK